MDYLKAILSLLTERLQPLLRSPLWVYWQQRLYRKRYLLGGLLLGIILSQLLGAKLKRVALQGQALGAPYHIQYLDRWGRSYQQEIAQLLDEIAQTLTASLPTAELAKFNAHDCSDFYFSSPLFYPLLAKSKEVYRNTQGAFDPTVLPWVEAWRHSTEGSPSPEQLRNLQAYVGLDYIVANAQRAKKLKEGIQLDFGGLLQGYAVDQIAALLRARGIVHMQVALGEKVMAYGRPSKRQAWHTALALSRAPWVATAAQRTLEVNDQAVATVGRQAQAAPHQALWVDPATGAFPQHTLLTAVVVAPDCMTAEAYATAMMIRGFAFAQVLLDQQTDLAALLVYEDENGAPTFYASPSLQHLVPAEAVPLAASF
ncbi:MAG: FAD:protein FMN transferase [Roseivirga sp.]